MAKKKKKTTPVQVPEVTITLPPKVVRQLMKIDSKETLEELAQRLLAEQATLYSKIYTESKSDNNIQISISKNFCKKFYEEACNNEAELKRKIVHVMEDEIHFMQFTLPRITGKIYGHGKKQA